MGLSPPPQSAIALASAALRLAELQGMNARMKKLVPAVSLSLVAAFGFSGCETPGQTALAGAATGAAIGGLATGRGRGALVGAAVGAGAGYVAGKVAQDRRGGPYYDPYTDEYYYEPRRGYYGRPVYYRESRYRRPYYYPY